MGWYFLQKRGRGEGRKVKEAKDSVSSLGRTGFGLGLIRFGRCEEGRQWSHFNAIVWM